MTAIDFRDRIRAMMTGRPLNEAKGAARAHPCLVRKPTDKGFYPPITTRKEQMNPLAKHNLTAKGPTGPCERTRSPYEPPTPEAQPTPLKCFFPACVSRFSKENRVQAEELGGGYLVECPDCCSGTGTHHTPESAISDWNAVANLIASAPSLKAEVERITAERDELLAACKIAVRHIESEGSLTARRFLIDAIANAEKVSEG